MEAEPVTAFGVPVREVSSVKGVGEGWVVIEGRDGVVGGGSGIGSEDGRKGGRVEGEEEKGECSAKTDEDETFHEEGNLR